MPRYFDTKNLTTEQAARWDDALQEYQRIQAMNVAANMDKLGDKERQEFASKYNCATDVEIRTWYTKMSAVLCGGVGHEKSALFARLLEGKRALRYAPPTAWSYPNYSVIDGDAPWEQPMLDGLDANLYKDTCVLLGQTPWTLLSRVGDDEAYVTYGVWGELGYSWRLTRELVSTVDSTAFICAWHDDTIGRITTLDQLKKECRWHADRAFRVLDYALDSAKAAAYKDTEITKHGVGYGGGVADQTIKAGHLQLAQRRANGLPDLPSEEERVADSTARVARYLQGDYVADAESRLYVKIWRLYRHVTPAIAGGIYA